MKKGHELKAVGLRKKGFSIKSIATELAVSASTVSRWCKDIVLTESQRQTLTKQQRKASLAALTPWIERNKLLKQEDLKNQASLGKADLGNISKRDLYVLGLGLYWGEGYKRGSQECGFTNSDPAIIRTILKWFEECFNVSIERISAQVSINILYEKESDRILNYWSAETGIPLEQFGRSTFISGYGKPARDSSTYTGTLRIKVRNGTSLRRRILAGIAAVDT
ncbi:MAG: hypothetical protein JWN64_805 [Parcubacteria group bacterium]|nr:hypothetical protein [Parcubacteria group bacterium]